MKKTYLLLFLLSFLSFLQVMTADVDLWGHLQFGGDMIKNRAVLHTHPYAYTVPGDYPSVHHQWGSEIIFYGLYSQFGYAGLIALKVVVGLLTSLFAYLVLKTFTSDPLLTLLLFFLVLRVLSMFSMVRPHLFTWLFLSVMVYWLCTGRKKYLPLLFFFWTNLHGGFVLGIVYLFLFEAGRFIQTRKMPLKHLLLPAGAALATLLNPYGIHLWVFLWKAATNPMTRRLMAEWRPVPIFNLSYLELKLYAVLFLLCLLFSKKEKDPAQALIGVAGLCISFLSRRNIPFFVLTTLPFLIFHLREFFSRFLLVQKLCTASLFCSAFVLSFILLPDRIQLDPIPEFLPVGAVQFMKEKHIKGNIFTSLNWGQYIIFHLYPGCKVSIDSRYDTSYPRKIILENVLPLISQNPKDLHVPFPSRTNLVLIPAEKPLTEKLKSEPGWVPLYEDKVATLFATKKRTRSP